MNPQTCPSDESCVLGAALLHRAACSPGDLFVRFGDGSGWTYAQAAEEALAAAGGLGALGIRPGDAVAVGLPNGPDMLKCWFGLALLGAVFVPINTDWRGRLLEHVLANAEPKVAVLHADLLPHLARVETGALSQVVVMASVAPPDAPSGLVFHGRAVLDGPSVRPADLPRRRPWDLMAVVYTSGTTGESKGVLTTHMHMAAMALGGRDMITARDHRLVVLPLFHSGGLQSVVGALLTGGSLTLCNGFRTQDFWRVVRESRATTVTLLGAMIGFLMKAPVVPGERDHALRSAFLVPYPADGQAFADRFGVATYTNYNSTETSNPLVSGRDPDKGGVCGQPRTGVCARLVDEHDYDVPDGQVGELLLRTDAPWAMSVGYHRNPQATADAWRNGWFHTGELFRRDGDGDLFFVDRRKDAIRRRGENISSAEVEREILAHPAVREAAVIGVPSEFGESDVLAAIALKEGATLEPARLLEFLASRMAHFMIPRYVRVLPALPRTATHKVQKYLLREAGLTPDTWDREREGIRIRQQRLTPD